MADPTTVSLEYVSNAIGAVAALGTSAYGLVDAAKAFWGGTSRFGLGSIKKAVGRFIDLDNAASADAWTTLKSNWLNGVGKAEQKATAKALIRLAITLGRTARVAAATNIPQADLDGIANNVRTGTALTATQVNQLGQVDTIVSAALDAGYERADQVYRNMSKLVAGIVAIGLAVAGGALISKLDMNAYWRWDSPDLWLAVLAGAVSTPLAPIAKDLASTLQAAAKAFTAVKR